MEILLSESDIAELVEPVADRLAGDITHEWTAVAILDGALPFAADLLRALSRREVNLRFDALRITSYGDEMSSSGNPRLLSGVTRPVKDAPVLLIDEVFDSGRTLEFAKQTLLEAGASEVKVCVFADKTSAISPASQADYAAWVAPDRFLVGYGMDLAGRYRGLPYIAAID